jgi:hypothetical protein
MLIDQKIIGLPPDGTEVFALKPAYGSLYCDGTGGLQTIPNGATYTKLLLYTHAGESDGTTPSTVNKNITIPSAGTYRVTFTSSILATQITQAIYRLFLNGVDVLQCSSVIDHTVTNKYFFAGFNAILPVSAGGVLDIRLRHSYGSSIDIATKYADFTVQFVGV